MAYNPASISNNAVEAENRAEAYRLRLRGLSFRAIGVQMGVSHETARKWTQVEAAELTLPLADELRKQQLDQLNDMRLAALAVLERKHVHISEGRVVRDKNPDTGEVLDPIEDDAPVLQAIDRLLKIADRTSKLLGLDAPQQQEIVATVEHKPAEVLDLIAQAKAQVAAEEAKLRGQS